MIDYKALLPRILAHQRVRKLRPGWYTAHCPECATLCDLDSNNNPFCPSDNAICDCHNVTPTYRHTGPDLLDPANLNDALGLADDIFVHGVSLGWEVAGSDGDYRKRIYFIGHIDETQFNTTAPTRPDAVVAAIARALGVAGGERREQVTQPDLRGFARAILNDAWIPCVISDTIDGGTLQEIAERHGLLIPRHVTEPCGDNCNCDDFPGTCYRVHESLRGDE